jgi:hypothetical protein
MYNCQRFATPPTQNGRPSRCGRFARREGERPSGRREHIGARADLEAITAELVDRVAVLDGITRAGYAGWRRTSTPSRVASHALRLQCLELRRM